MNKKVDKISKIQIELVEAKVDKESTKNEMINKMSAIIENLKKI